MALRFEIFTSRNGSFATVPALAIRTSSFPCRPTTLDNAFSTDARIGYIALNVTGILIRLQCSAERFARNPVKKNDPSVFVSEPTRSSLSYIPATPMIATTQFESLLDSLMVVLTSRKRTERPACRNEP